MDPKKWPAPPPSAPPSFQKVSSVPSSSPAPPQTVPIKYSPVPGPEDRIPVVILGQTYQTVSELPNMHSCPTFGLFTSSSSSSEFGDQANLGLSTLPMHTQLQAFSELWRPTEMDNSRAAALFHPLLGLHPFFVPAFQTHNPADSQLNISGVNGWSTSLPDKILNISQLQAKEKEKTQNNLSCSQKSFGDHLQNQTTILTAKGKDLMKIQLEMPRLIGSLSGSLSESSSEETTSDSDNMEKDEEDLSSNSNESDSEKEIPVKKKHLTPNASESKEKGPFAGDENACQESLCHSVPVTSSDRLQSHSHPFGLPTCTTLFFQSARPAEQKSQQHTSVIHPTGLAIDNISLAQSHSKACRSHSNPDPKPILSRYKSTQTPPRHQIPSSLPNQRATSKHLCAGLLKPLITKPYTLLASEQSSHECKALLPQSKMEHPVDCIKDSNKNSPYESLLHLEKRKKKKFVHLMGSVKKASSVGPRNQICDPNQFLNPHPHRAISTACQDAPLALMTKPGIQTSSPNSRPLLAATSPPYLTPINLSTGTNEMSDTSASPLKTSAPSGLVPESIKFASVLHGGWKPAEISSCRKPVDLTKSWPDFHSSKASENSSGDDEDEDEDEENGVGKDSGSSLSDSESNPESDAGDHRTFFVPEAHTDADRSALKPAEASLSSLNVSSNCYLLNLQVTKPSGQHGNPLPSLTFATTPGSKKRRRVTDERVLQLPLKFGWQRETRMRTVAGRLQGEVTYLAPCGKKLRQYPDVVKYLVRHGITDISRDNFSFSTKIKVGNFYEGREGPKGLQWSLMAEEDIAHCIIAMDGRRSRQTKSKDQPTANDTEAKYDPVNDGEPHLQDVTDAKLLRKLEAQEMARQAAQIKMRKLRKQAIEQATKEAKKQQAIMAAEERRKRREEMKIIKQQEKIKRIQHIRMEKELRAQQVLEAKRKKKEAAANLKMLEADKRNKEREIRKLQSVIQKQEKERRRQHMILMKAVEAQKKAEEKERLKKEKKEEKQLNKKKKLELRKLELTKAKELMKPKEDMCLADHKPLPDLSCIPGLILPGKTFSDCLMVLQFVRNFGTVLKLGCSSNQLTISNLQDGLLNIGKSLQMVQHLLVSMVSAAVNDPGIPAGHKCKTLLGDHLTNVEINRDNVSEILQIYMEAHCEQTEVAALACSLQTKAFQAHSPSEKATMLAFLVNELCCSKAVIGKIDKNIDYMTNLRKDKWVLEGKLRKLRNIHAKTTETSYSNVGEEKNHTFNSYIVQNKCKGKNGDSEEEEDQNEDGEDQGEDYDVEDDELRGKKKKKAELCEGEETTTHSGDISELETKIQETCKLHSEISQKLFEASHSLRSMMVGEDRYRRHYWLLPQCGGIFIEGVENGWEEFEKEGGRQRASVCVKEEQQEEISEPRTENIKTKAGCQQNNDGVLLQKSLSKLSEVLEAATMDRDSNINLQKIHPTEGSVTEPYQSYFTPQTDKTSVSSVLSAAQLENNCLTCSPPSILPYDQPSSILGEKNNEWFSLLPRSPCDGSYVVSNTSRPAFCSSSQLVRTKPSLFLFSNTPKKNTKAGNNRLQSAVSELDLTSQEAEGNRDEDLCLADCNSVNKSETTEPLSNRPTCASFPAQEVAKTQDFICPQPVPEEMLRGWWRISDMENLHSLVSALHSRGIRERVLQKQIQKNVEHMTQIYANSTNEFDTKSPEMHKMSREIFEGWCVEQRAMEVDTSLLLQVEALEKNVISADLHIQGWMPCKPKSEGEDLVCFEHKPSSSVSVENKKLKEMQQENLPDFLKQRSNNRLDRAVSRLADLERNIERRNKEEVATGMRQWHKALGQVRSSAQLSLCIQHLQKYVVWKRDDVTVRRQLCQKGDNEELLLFCDGCNRRCHNYCHNPKITMVPAGDWFCSFCSSVCSVIQESGQIPPSRKQQSQTAGEKQKGSEVKQNGKPSVMGDLFSERVARSNNGPKRGPNEFKKRKGEDSSQAKYDGPVPCAKKAKTPKDSSNELAVCRVLLADLEAHQDAWPFLSPVRHKSVPGYRKVIKKPMDFSTIKEKLTNNLYLNLENFIVDVNLVFDNCQRFNEDDSEIGRAGHRMRRFFDKRWAELLHF
ncbi:bromodomain adjacent to zinc finger domain protein 2B isoform X4 [Girardinichthys multiradiatus]|uniref:bromodomain adjacent to zinc finger domain protein 2B isoform X4 n=1 Tax=Girardinichthys multiradiatus TaxID=208333 RepID=UPI001FAE20D1|nr:bromodomain adjacent to zinc finger domain protein 2B isoform X4 [Girardinichthys multiradiatus]